MPIISNLTAKRATLVSQLEQFVGQINRINGAIAVLDKLLAEDAREREREEAAEAFFGGLDRSISTYWRNATDTVHWGIHEGDAPSVIPEDLSAEDMTPPAPHQMQPFLAPDEDAA